MSPLADLTSIRILGHDCRIVYGPIEDMDGDFDRESCVIRIDSKLPRSRRDETLLHEIVHACDLLSAPDEDNLTEAQVWRISAVLYAALTELSGDIL